METVFELISHVGLGIALLLIIISLRITENKVAKLEAKNKDLNDVLFRMWELSRTEEGRQFASDMVLSYNRMRDKGFSDAMSYAQNHLRGRRAMRKQSTEEEQE